MSDAPNGFITITNNNSPFTELFSLLKQYGKKESWVQVTENEYKKLSVLNEHIDNAIGILMQGLQGIGQLIGVVAAEQELSEEISQIGFFISAIGNLTEALSDLKSDSKSILKERKVGNY